MDDKTKNNKFAMKQLENVYAKRNDTINKQKEEFKIQVTEGEINFIRNQRVLAYERASSRLGSDKSVQDVLTTAQEIFEFLVADGVYSQSSLTVLS